LTTARLEKMRLRLVFASGFSALKPELLLFPAPAFPSLFGAMDGVVCVDLAFFPFKK